MTGPDDATREQPVGQQETAQQEVVEQPTVSTAPPPVRPRNWWSTIPRHLGRARTSTVVIGVLFLALFALYLNVRPDPERTATTGGDTEVTEPATPTGSTTPATTPPATTPRATDTAPTTTGETSTSGPTSDSTAPSTTTSTLPPTGTTTEAPLPTTSVPTG